MNISKKRLIMYAAISGIIIFIAACACAVDPSPGQDEVIDNAVEGTNDTGQTHDPVSYVRPENREAAMNYQVQSGEIVVYDLDDAEFLRFLETPSIDYLVQNSSQIWAYRKNERAIDDRFMVEAERMFPSHIKQHSRSGGFRIGSWPVYTEFIDFMNTPESFVEILSDNHIQEEVLNVAIFTHFMLRNAVSTPIGQPTAPGTYRKMCMWIQTESGNYILEDRFFSGNDPRDTTWTYRFYDLAMYRLIYGSPIG